MFITQEIQHCIIDWVILWVFFLYRGRCGVGLNS